MGNALPHNGRLKTATSLFKTRTVSGILYELLPKNTRMNKHPLIAGGIIAGAAALLYFFNKKKKSLDNLEHIPVTPSRHLTESFARAKQHAYNGSGQRISMSDKIE